MPITMQELANMAGVSRATVDRALNERGRVNQKTKDRICQLAKTMGYEPDLAAKTLASKNKIFRIGCILNSRGNTFFNDVEKGIQAAIDELNGFNIEVTTRSPEHLNASCQLTVINDLYQKGIQALIITPLNVPEIADRLNALIAEGIAVIALTADILGVNYLSYVGCNHLKSGQITANIAGLIAPPGAKILFVLGSKSLLGHSQRLEGFLQVLNESYPDMQVLDIIENQDDDFISYNLVHNYIADHPATDLIVFAAGGSTGGIRAIQDSSCHCRIICFDLTSHNRHYLEEGLISCVLCQEPYTQGYQALKLLSGYLLLGKSPDTDRYYTKTEILVKKSL